jgi:RNA polymerase sigma-70 factor (ECF subfamily)
VPPPSSRTSQEEHDALEAADRAMAHYADGDDAAFATVFAAVGTRLLRFLRRLCGADDLAGDLLQETLLRMHQARGAFRPGAPVLPWSYTIARNVFLDAARARRRQPVPLSSVEPEGHAEVQVGAEAESALLAREAARAVERALARMTDARREAFVLIRFEGMSIADAAEILGTTENAVKLRAFQAYEALRDELVRLETGRRVS